MAWVGGPSADASSGVPPTESGGGEGGEGGGGGGGEAIKIVGTASTATPSSVEAASAVPSVEASEVCSASAVVEAGTMMVAVMRTLAAVTLIVTSDLSTPATFATFSCKLDLSLSV